MLAAQPASAPRTTSPSAPARSARSAAPRSRTSTSTEIPSPSAIAWLSRRAVTGADARRCIPPDRCDGRERHADVVRCGPREQTSSASFSSGPSRRASRRSPPRSPAATTPSGTPSTAVLHADRPRAANAPGRARSSRTSPASTAGTRTSSRARARGPLRGHGCVHDRASSTRCTSAGPRPTSPSSSARRYDLFVVCGLDVPWRHDGIREFDEQRRTMHERYVERARRSGSPWLLVEGRSKRGSRAAAAAVDRRAPRIELGETCVRADRRRHEVGTNSARFLSPIEATSSIGFAAGGGLGCPGSARSERTAELSTDRVPDRLQLHERADLPGAALLARPHDALDVLRGEHLERRGRRRRRR